MFKSGLGESQKLIKLGREFFCQVYFFVSAYALTVLATNERLVKDASEPFLIYFLILFNSLL